ncbi:hypothetical protein AOQ84DRAFT_405943 [Glonium stellatum]|uniref:Flavin reductase like domain-containing protein n=1 Tax=Glonium stellatum TaxID=574774 RepID=A0A8E2F1L9_9PEZI|nr:hypothetical protein AOQ84DRAFT_405943 [Glonium stellatum]
MAVNTHTTISPAIFYWGTPVVLISTTNPDGTTNIAPMSSAWWLGNRCMLGLGRVSQTVTNLTRTRECVLNLPSADLAPAVNRLARTTGNREAMAAQSAVSSAFKRATGYEFVADKFARAGLTVVASEVVAPDRVGECAAQMECELVGVYEFMPGAEAGAGAVALDVRVLRTHVSEGIRMEGFANRVDPEKWRPLIMCFQELFGMGEKVGGESVLARIGEENYRSLASVLDAGIERQMVEKEAVVKETAEKEIGEKNN